MPPCKSPVQRIPSARWLCLFSPWQPSAGALRTFLGVRRAPKNSRAPGLALLQGHMQAQDCQAISNRTSSFPLELGNIMMTVLIQSPEKRAMVGGPGARTPGFYS